MNDFDLDARFFAAQAVARDGGRLELRHFRNRDPLTVEMKGAQDMARRPPNAASPKTILIVGGTPMRLSAPRPANMGARGSPGIGPIRGGKPHCPLVGSGSGA